MATATEEVAKIWNLRNLYGKPIGDDVKARIKKIKSEAPVIPNFRRGVNQQAWKPSNYGQRQFNTLQRGGIAVPANASSAPTAAPLPPTVEKYVSRFKKVDQPASEKILNNVILSKLNKFSSETFTDIEQFLCQILDSGETEFIKDFMMLVFRKAAAEEVFCPLYAKLLSKLSHKYPQLLEEMASLYKSYLSIFDDLDSSNALYKEKAYRRGYSQFLAELAGLEVLERDCIVAVFTKLVGLIKSTTGGDMAVMDEYCDCLLRISRVMKKSAFYKETKAKIRTLVASDLEELKVPNPALMSNKQRFQIMDIYENIS